MAPVYPSLTVARSQRWRALALLLVFVGFAALVAAWMLSSSRARPSATGDIGLLEAYGQLSDGPVRLWPDRVRRLPRPQDVAFRFSADGTGPRLVRIEVDTRDERITAYERMHSAPIHNESLDYVLQLSEEVPDRVDVWVTIEAPHASAVVSRFMLHLVGPARRFWEPSP